MSQAESLARLPEEQRARILADLSDAQHEELLYDWRFWARPEQLEPEGSWLKWLVLAGRGYGKTRVGAEQVRSWACGETPLSAGRYRRIALVAETAADARDVMVEGESGILQCHPPDCRPLYEPSKRRITWPNGAIATLYNGSEPDQLRGPQHDAAWCDELAKYQYAQDAWDQLQFGLRLGDSPRQVITTTPKPIPVLKAIIADEATVVTRGSTYENRSNLAPAFFHTVIKRYEGTRLGRQELNAEILDDVPGALWTRGMIDGSRVNVAPEMRRIVVAVDPSGTTGEDNGDSIGIVVAGRGVDGRGYVLADLTCSMSPAGWGRRVVDAYRTHRADRVVAEKNYGGAMVQHVIHTADRNVAYRGVDAARGKSVRAEPIAALYEQGRVSHVGAFPDLEDQMVSFTSDGYLGGTSPDRADALVWALTDLMLHDHVTVSRSLI